MGIALFPSYDTASSDIPPAPEHPPEYADLIANAEAVLDEYDHQLHLAVGTRHNHTDSFGALSNGRPDKQTGGGSQGGGSGNGSGGGGGKQKGGGGKQHKGSGGGGGSAKLGNARLAGPGSIGTVPPLQPTVTSGTPQSGSGSPVMIIVILGAVAIGGYLLWHRLHKAKHEEDQMNREESSNKEE